MLLTVSLFKQLFASPPMDALSSPRRQIRRSDACVAQKPGPLVLLSSAVSWEVMEDCFCVCPPAVSFVTLLMAGHAGSTSLGHKRSPDFAQMFLKEKLTT